MREWAGIYVAMGRVGFSQTDVDEMELWVIAAHLAAHYPSPDDDLGEDGDPTGEGVALTEEQFHRRSMAIIQQRIAAAADDTSPEEDT